MSFSCSVIPPKFMKEMSNGSHLLKKLTNISEECSGIESDAISSKLSPKDGTVHIQSEASETEDGDGESTANNENENLVNMPRKR